MTNTERLRVAMICFPACGGIAEYTNILSGALHCTGNQVTLWGNRDFAFDLTNLVYDFRPLFRRRRHYALDLVTAYRDTGITAAPIAHFQFHISPLAEIAFAKFARRRGIATVMTAHDVLPHQLKPYDRMLFRTLYSSLDAVIVHAQQNRRTAVDFLGLPESKLHVIPHGNYMHYDVADAPSRSQALERLGYNRNTKLILFFGAVRPDKGLDRLIKSLPEIKRTIPEAKILSAGPVKGAVDDALTYFGGLVRSLGLEDAVDLRFGYVPHQEVPVYFAASAVVALPYVESTQSGVVQIAAATRRAVVASAVGGIPEVIDQGETGLLVQPDNTDELAAAIITYLTDLNLADSAGEKAYEKAKREYSWDIIANKTVDVYRAISR